MVGVFLRDCPGIDQTGNLLAEVAHERAVLAAVIEGRSGDHALGVRQDIVINEGRRLDSVSQRNPRILKVLFHVCGHAIETGDVGLGIGFGGDLVLIDQESRNLGLRAVHLVKDVAVVAVFVVGLGGLQVQLGDAPREFGLMVQQGRIERRLHFGNIGALDLQLFQHIGVGDIVPLTVIVLDAEIGLRDRAAGNGLVELLVEPRIEPGGCCRDVLRAGRGW